MDSEVKAFLSSRNNLSLAWDISEAFEEMKEHVYLTFWKNVRNFIESFLQENDYSDNWTVVMDEEDCSDLFIQPNNLKEDCCAYKVGADSLNGNPYGACYYGIYRGKDIKREFWIKSDVELSKELVADGFRSTKWWLGWKYISYIGLPQMEGEEKEELLDINDDNSNDQTPLAERAAKAIFELFEKYRQQLEVLNKSYPY